MKRRDKAKVIRESNREKKQCEKETKQFYRNIENNCDKKN